MVRWPGQECDDFLDRERIMQTYQASMTDASEQACRSRRDHVNKFTRRLPKVQKAIAILEDLPSCHCKLDKQCVRQRVTVMLWGMSREGDLD